MEIKQYDIFWVDLNPTIGSEIRKVRPCVVVSPNEMNAHIRTIVVAPLTTASKNYPTRVPVMIGGKKGWIVIDQIRTIDKARLQKKVGVLAAQTVTKIKQIIKETFVD